MFSENSSDLQPPKPGQAIWLGQISQIPGLSPTVSTISEEKARGRRSGVLDSDSDYVKLAKQGGHKRLLWHDDKCTLEPKTYKPPAWFCTEDSSKPSETSSDEKKPPGAFQWPQPPFGTDNLTAWEREDTCGGGGEEKNNNVPISQPEKQQQPQELPQHINKFKRIVFNKKPVPVNMSKLLSFGYVEDNKPREDDAVSSQGCSL